MGAFRWREAVWHLRAPVLAALFQQLSQPGRLQPLGLVEVLDWTAAALDRVDRVAFFSRFNEGEAVPYFYEPFLQAFDPDLRKQLGVWYTPTEVVRYMVARVDKALKDDLGIADGLAAENVYVLDPCCGTGAYLAEVLRRIAANLEGQGLGALAGARAGCSAMPTSRPPSATRISPRAPCSTRRTGSRAASPTCSTAGRRTVTERRPTERCPRAPRCDPARVHAPGPARRRAVLGVSLPPRRQAAPRHARQAGAVKADRARAAALGFLAREKGGGKPLPPPPSGPTLTKFAVGIHGTTLARADAARFFHEYGRRKPSGANRCHEILRTMFDCAIAWGHRPEAAGNPCTGIARYRLPPRGRLLGADDLAKLGATLRRLEGECPLRVAAVRLILLTGCRPGEIHRLRWCEVKPDRLALIDAKTGPRHVLLGEAARTLLDSLADSASGEWCSPAIPGTDR